MATEPLDVLTDLMVLFSFSLAQVCLLHLEKVYKLFRANYIVRTTTTAVVVALQYRETFGSLTLANQVTTRQCLRRQHPAGGALFPTALNGVSIMFMRN